MIQKYRFNFTGDDKIAFANMIFVCQRNLPVKIVVGYDDKETPYIFAGFVGENGVDFDFWRFSTIEVAQNAFSELQTFLYKLEKIALKEFAENTSDGNNDPPF